MTPSTVLDASAVLAFLQGEPGADLVGQSLQSEHCVVTAANHAEVIAKSLDRGAHLTSSIKLCANWATPLSTAAPKTARRPVGCGCKRVHWG